MKLPLLLALLLSTTLTLASPIPGDSPLISVEGRYQSLDTENVTRLGFPGTTLHLRFTGQKAIFHYEASSEQVLVDIQLNDTPYQRHQLTKGTATLELTAPPTTTAHELRIVLRTEGYQGTLKALSFEAPDGEIIQGPPLPKKKLLFIGDSITAGAATDYRKDDPKSGFLPSNGRYSYGYQLSRILDTQCHLVAFGGKGLVRDWQGMRSEPTAPNYYEQSLPNDPSTVWDNSQYIPDAVFICLGQNDFNKGIPDEEDWTAAYIAFIRKISRDAPNAPFFLLESPMYGPDNIKRLVARRYLNRVKDALPNIQIHLIQTAYLPGPTNAHPDKDGQKQIAEHLAPLVRETLQ
ncbi:SGNH/GDSL hydrolase family protein [Pelagicoccus mobilis]|uniref:Endoglucanase E n=1 Tax=Pelagicoccus mobilis TaxID=415221 RepID=A0A934RZB5_9BACT|nr:SGNH/GDSL hydrolase family protein [Pelagicoccus mobilis]MBK1879088.1 hypothetical protein [Pelagicoccus mobilis]